MTEEPPIDEIIDAMLKDEDFLRSVLLEGYVGLLNMGLEDLAAEHFHFTS